MKRLDQFEAVRESRPVREWRIILALTMAPVVVIGGMAVGVKPT
jgi:hypothetical protein